MSFPFCFYSQWDLKRLHIEGEGHCINDQCQGLQYFNAFNYVNLVEMTGKNHDMAKGYVHSMS